MKNSTKAAIVATILAADGACHIYWATGARWPARTTESLSRAVLNVVVSFGPQITLPLAALLWTAAGLVVATSRGRGGRVAAVGAAAVGVGLAIRGVAGLVWLTGLGAQVGSAFYWLNLFAYTPVCLALAPMALSVARGPRPGGGVPGRRRNAGAVPVS